MTLNELRGVFVIFLFFSVLFGTSKTPANDLWQRNNRALFNFREKTSLSSSSPFSLPRPSSQSSENYHGQSSCGQTRTHLLTLTPELVWHMIPSCAVTSWKIRESVIWFSTKCKLKLPWPSVIGIPKSRLIHKAEQVPVPTFYFYLCLYSFVWAEELRYVPECGWPGSEELSQKFWSLPVVWTKACWQCSAQSRGASFRAVLY